MKKITNIFKKMMGLIVLGFMVYCGVTLMDEVIIDEIEDFIHDMSPIVVDDGCHFDLDDFILGTTMMGSLLYTAISLIEGIFRKEKRES